LTRPSCAGELASPDEVVIKGPNRVGRPVVWTYWQNGEIRIRCFAPGGGV
jgi:hypothetical protein